MYKDYSDTPSVGAYSSYEPSYSSPAYHHRSYGSGPLPIQPLASPSNNNPHAEMQPQQQPQQQQQQAHDMAYRGYLPPTPNNNNNIVNQPYGAAQ